jgi:hypothetical protein
MGIDRRLIGYTAAQRPALILHVDVLQLGAGEVKELALARPLLGDGPKREALQIERPLPQLHIRPLDHNAVFHCVVVEKPTYSADDTGWSSVSRCDCAGHTHQVTALAVLAVAGLQAQAGADGLPTLQ